jgi:hypothetical protein
MSDVQYAVWLHSDIDLETKAEWKATFGANAIVPVTSSKPIMKNLTGRGLVLAYALDLDALDQRQRLRVERFIANRFGLSQAQVQEQLATLGLPIPAADVTLVTR